MTWVQLRPQDIRPRPNLPSRPTASTNAAVPRPVQAVAQPLSPPLPDKVLDLPHQPLQHVLQSISILADDGLSLQITTYNFNLLLYLISRFRR